MPNSAQERFIQRLRTYKKVERVRGIRAAVYTTYNEVLLCVLYSGGTTRGKYWYGIDCQNLGDWGKRGRLVICLICGDENTVIFIPDDKLTNWYQGVKTNKKGQWMLNIVPNEDKLFLHVIAGRTIDLTEYINRYDFVATHVPLPDPLRRAPYQQSVSPQDVPTEGIMGNPELVGDSLHERVIDMLAHIGDWMGHVVEKGYRSPPDSPYEVDIVWLDRGLVEVAVEVQIGGNETEAKDRLVHAKRFGARKVIVVSTPDSTKRLKSLCRYEPDLRNWLEAISKPCTAG